MSLIQRSKPWVKKPPKALSALEVKPDRVYLAELTYGAWTPVIVRSAKTHGWLRGDVQIESYDSSNFGPYRAKARVEDLESGAQLAMMVFRRPNDTAWMFCNEAGRCTLVETQPGFFDRKLTSIDEEVRLLDAQKARLLQTANELAVKKLRYD